MCCAAQGLRAALEIVCILALVGSRSPLLAGCLVLASPLAAPAIKALSGAIQSASRDAQLAAATTASAADEVSVGVWCGRRAKGLQCCRLQVNIMTVFRPHHDGSMSFTSVQDTVAIVLSNQREMEVKIANWSWLSYKDQWLDIVKSS